MIREVIGDLLESRAQTLVNTVNCVGVMGKGVALRFKQRFPEMYRDYVHRCKAGRVRLGEPYMYRGLEPPAILNFPTKGHWRSDARLEDIVRGLEHLTAHYKEWGIESLAVPPLGCGEGGLEWRIVRATLCRNLGALEILVEVYAPLEGARTDAQGSFMAQPEDALAFASGAQARIDPAWVATLQVLAGLGGPVPPRTFVALTYFATEAGVPTGLGYSCRADGVDSLGVGPIIRRLTNNGLLLANEGGSTARLSPGPTYRDAMATWKATIAPMGKAVARTTALLKGTTSAQAVVLAAAHWAARHPPSTAAVRPSQEELVALVASRLRRVGVVVGPGELAQGVGRLTAGGWLAVTKKATVFAAMSSAVRSGRLNRRFTVAQLREACPGFVRSTYGNFTSAHAEGNPAGNAALFRRLAPGEYEFLFDPRDAHDVRGVAP